MINFFSKNTLLICLAAVLALTFALSSCGKIVEVFPDLGPSTDNEEGTTVEPHGDSTEKISDDTEEETDAETEPELTDELPREFDEDDIRDEIRDKIIYSEYNERIPLYSEDYKITVTYAQSYVIGFKVIAEGTITDSAYSFDFDAEFERISNNWELTKCELTYTGDRPRGFDFEDAELQLEARLGYDVDVTDYTENEDGSYTVTYDYVKLDVFAPICIKYSGSTAKYMPYEYCSDVWYIDNCHNGAWSYAYMDKTFGEFTLTDGNVTLNFTVADDAVDFYNKYRYYSLEYTVTLSDGTVYENFSTVSPSSDSEFSDWDNNDYYIHFWHTFVFEIGSEYYEFSYRAYENKSELSGWYLEDVKLTEA